MRIVRTTLAGWKRYKDHPNPRLRERYAWEARELSTTYAAVVHAARLYLRQDSRWYAVASQVLADLCAEFGFKARLAAALGGRYVLWKMRREARRLAAGWCYEPPTFYETNDSRQAFPNATARNAPMLCRFITLGPLSPSKLITNKKSVNEPFAD